VGSLHGVKGLRCDSKNFKHRRDACKCCCCCCLDAFTCMPVPVPLPMPMPEIWCFFWWQRLLRMQWATQWGIPCAWLTCHEKSSRHPAHLQ